MTTTEALDLRDHMITLLGPMGLPASAIARAAGCSEQDIRKRPTGKLKKNYPDRPTKHDDIYAAAFRHMAIRVKGGAWETAPEREVIEERLSIPTILEFIRGLQEAHWALEHGSYQGDERDIRFLHALIDTQSSHNVWRRWTDSATILLRFLRDLEDDVVPKDVWEFQMALREHFRVHASRPRLRGACGDVTPEEVSTAIQEAIDWLSDSGRRPPSRVLRVRFGYDHGRFKSIPKTSERLGLPPSRIRQLLRVGLTAIRYQFARPGSVLGRAIGLSLSDAAAMREDFEALKQLLRDTWSDNWSDPSLAVLKALARPVDELELSVRNVNMLESLHITHLIGLTRYTEERLLGIAGYGRKSLDELKERLAENQGLTLGMQHSPETIAKVRLLIKVR